jgi:hypothetical protein
MKTFLKNTLRNPFLPLVLVFFLLHFIVTQDGGQNAASRLLSMRGMAEKGSFSIDPYLKSTDDWALAPSGLHYSNKAPGPMILGFPIFYFLDEMHRPFEKTPEDGIRPQPEYFQSISLSFFLQSLPFGILCLLIVAWMLQSWIDREVTLFFLLAALFGNTAIVFMNSYFGHAFSAFLQLAGIFYLYRKSYGLAGLFFSFTLLSDYGFAFQIPALVIALILNRPKLRDISRFVLFSIPAGFGWILYHGILFGSPFVVASKFQNPVFLESSTDRFWGMFSLPHWPWVWELVFGASRGLIIQQPWIFFLLPLSLWVIFFEEKKKDLLVPMFFCLMSIAGLLFMNASFNGWHGGASAGPRYLSGVLPCFAFWAALCMNGCNRKLRILLWAGLILAILFRGLMYGGTILAPLEPLWTFYWNEFLSRGTPKLRTFLFFFFLMAGLLWSGRRAKNIWI